jgi:FOG: CheY-like receiver
MFDKTINIGRTTIGKEHDELEHIKSFSDNSILLVEDNEIHCQLIAATLENICRVEIAKSGEEAIAMASRSTYPAILMDINLGEGLSGIEATRQIRKIPRYRITPIIAVTGCLLNGTQQDLLNSGFSFCIEKPFPINHLRAVVSDVLGLRSQNPE